MIGCYDIICSYVYGHSGGGGGGEGRVPSGVLAWRRVEPWRVPTIQTASEPLFSVTGRCGRHAGWSTRRQRWRDRKTDRRLVSIIMIIW